MANCNNLNPIDMDNTRGSFQSEKLTKQEREIYGQLSQTRHNSLWGAVIERVIQGGCINEFRTMLVQLKQQAKEGPAVMKSIIGEHAFQLIMKGSFS